MADILNLLLALATIGFGAAGWLAPRWTMEKVDLRDGGSTMGLSEVRAASGALFVVAGVGAIRLGRRRPGSGDVFVARWADDTEMGILRH